ncbi:hypothetical protein HCB26_12915 [Listeria booriae]|uniref:Polymerase n=1 Tax=Listeria booriae TaxID=1552123 RepID=A0A7X0Z1V8_9LIST|nr:hypothetical protein [Listeria booriae]MBC2167475.1 hypothetical protein [Listeria booriae]
MKKEGAPIGIKIERLITCSAVLLYVIFLDIAYVTLISPVYSYYTLTNFHPALYVMGISTLLAVLPACFAQIRVNRPSQAVFWILYMFVYIPIMVIPDFVRENPLDMFVIFKLCVLLSLGILYGMSRVRLLSVYQARIHPWLVGLGLFLLADALLFILIKTYGFHLRLVGFDDVYAVRSEYRSATDGLSGYALSWWSKIVGPGVMVFGLVKRKYVVFGAGFLLQIFAYTISGQKSIALTALFLIGIMLAMCKRGKYFGMNFALLAFLMVFGCLSVDWLTDGIRFTELISRRLLMLPAALTSHFFDFFTVNPKTYLGYGPLKDLFPYPYDLPKPAFLIGRAYFGNGEISANANFWADSYSAFGYVGVVLFTMILAALLWLYDSITTNKSLVFFTCLIAMPVWGLIDSSLITSLLTHGLLIVTVLAYFLPIYDQKTGARNE